MNRDLARQYRQGFLPWTVDRDDQFCHFGNCGPNLGFHHAEWHGDLWEPKAWESDLDSRWMAHGMVDLISKPAWRYTIEGTPDFGSFWTAKMTPFWDPNFSPRVVNWRPHITLRMGSLDLFQSCAVRYGS